MSVLVKEGKHVLVVESDIAREAVAIGRKHRKTFRVLTGYGDLVLPQEENGWIYIPEELDDSPRPERELAIRKRILQRHGIKGYRGIVAHETEVLNRVPERERQWERQKELVKDTTIQIGSFLAGALGVLLASAVMIDPAYIWVLPNPDGSPGQWLEVLTWDEGFH